MARFVSAVCAVAAAVACVRAQRDVGIDDDAAFITMPEDSEMNFAPSPDGEARSLFFGPYAGGAAGAAAAAAAGGYGYAAPYVVPAFTPYYSYGPPFQYVQPGAAATATATANTNYGGGYAPNYGGGYAPNYGGGYAPNYGGGYVPQQQVGVPQSGATAEVTVGGRPGAIPPVAQQVGPVQPVPPVVPPPVVPPPVVPPVTPSPATATSTATSTKETVIEGVGFQIPFLPRMDPCAQLDSRGFYRYRCTLNEAEAAASSAASRSLSGAPRALAPEPEIAFEDKTNDR